jgi:nitrite reductase (NADH) small subunit
MRLAADQPQPPMATSALSRTYWHVVCDLADLTPEHGVTALVRGIQIAVFRLYDGRVFAVGNIDPFSGAAVLSRGIVGTRGSVATVTSPLHKQVFDLVTGRCLDQPQVSVPRYDVRLMNGKVELGFHD